MENSPCLDQNARRDGVGALPRSDFRDALNKSIAENRVPGFAKLSYGPVCPASSLGSNI
jgi:hypothetical protein